MENGIATKYFAGANTCRGFYSLFHYIPTEKTKRFLILKGGPGTGKSTLMKQIATQALAAGKQTEMFYCSSDHDSLDAVSIPALGIAIVDGTAPHIIEPTIPGAYDEIINLGDFWNVSALQPEKEIISDLMRQNSNWFKQAYQYLKEAAVVAEKLRWLMAQAMDFNGIRKLIHQLVTELTAALPPADGPGKERHLFGSAITPAGLVNLYPSILQTVKNFYYLTGDPGSGKSYLLEQIRQAVLRAGHDVHVYRCSFDPERLDAVVIPAIDTAFVKLTYPHTFSLNPLQPVDKQITLSLGRYAKPSLLKHYAAERSENMERFWYLLEKAVEMIKAAKKNHDLLESYYVKAMDFERLTKVQEKIMASVLEAN
ncbi:MAG: hypothetical protein GX922_01595 [Firmicutes bacterium]|jgi:Cdc6-like AAA superfamily ATPase|nr:hypothetical protein [Bacillota bacterium]